MMFCATPGVYTNGTTFVHTPYVYWKMGAYQNVTPDVETYTLMTFFIISKTNNIAEKRFCFTYAAFMVRIA